MNTARQRGLTRLEVVAGTVACAVLGSFAIVLAEPGERGARLAEALNNIRLIDAASSHYRADNAGKYPWELTRAPRRNSPTLSGWCNWGFGGKNCNAWWYDTLNGAFDVEAADRPLNPYLYPAGTFAAPPPPARLGRDDPDRVRAQAKVFRDPADIESRHRSWPNPTPGISAYNDVGTSFGNVMGWWDGLPQIIDFTARFNEGTRRLATGEGVDTSRFITYDDFMTEAVTWSRQGADIENPHGGLNRTVCAFYDGHAAYLQLTRNVPNTAAYQTYFGQ